MLKVLDWLGSKKIPVNAKDSEGVESRYGKESLGKTPKLEGKEGSERRVKQCKDWWIIVTSALSTLLFSRSNRLNMQPSMIGFYLHGENVYWAYTQSLHRWGLSKSYPHIIGCNKINAQRALAVIWGRVKTEAYILLWDNINRLIKVVPKWLHNKNYIVNWTSICIICLKDGN